MLNIILHRSNDIRWSMDLRWQDPGLPNGRGDPTELMPVMRDSNRPDMKQKDIDWSVLTNRQHKDRETFLIMKEGETLVEDEFEMRIGGPWMRRWPIVNHNKHTEYELNKNTS